HLTRPDEVLGEHLRGVVVDLALTGAARHLGIRRAHAELTGIYPPAAARPSATARTRSTPGRSTAPTHRRRTRSAPPDQPHHHRSHSWSSSTPSPTASSATPPPASS